MSTETFYWTYGGTLVQFACSQTGWTPAKMTHDDGVWYCEIELAPGKCEYKFIVDGEWCYDMLKDTVDDSFGGKNNVMHVDEHVELHFKETPKAVDYHSLHSCGHETVNWPPRHGIRIPSGWSDIAMFPTSDIGIPLDANLRRGTQTYYSGYGPSTTINWG